MPPTSKATQASPAEPQASPDENSILQLYEQDFDSWEFTEAQPRVSLFCDSFPTLGGHDVT
ncbi:MAG: hypothetical protein RL145_115 [Pseudomonadota bacterium]